MSVRYEILLKNNEKKSLKCLENKNKALPLHPQSERMTNLRAAKKKVLKNILKKVSKKFGSFKNMIYLCTRFRL
jgi:hypothetical protein